ncbi:MAG: hypothetical protein R2735_15780 [Microthrixaceae bacterium]
MTPHELMVARSPPPSKSAVSPEARAVNMLIAATALAEGLALVTRNQKTSTISVT